MTGIVEALRVEMANIGVDLVHEVEGERTVNLLVRGKGNRRVASCVVPAGIVSSDEESRVVREAVASIKAQLTGKSGSWPEGYTP